MGKGAFSCVGQPTLESLEIQVFEKSKQKKTDQFQVFEENGTKKLPSIGGVQVLLRHQKQWSLALGSGLP
jgi:hypothetical protein